MGNLVLHEYVIKNGGYYGLMQNELVVKFEIAIFFLIFCQYFYIFDTFAVKILMVSLKNSIGPANSFLLSIITSLYDDSKLVKFEEIKILAKKSAKNRKIASPRPKIIFFKFF